MYQMIPSQENYHNFKTEIGIGVFRRHGYGRNKIFATGDSRQRGSAAAMYRSNEDKAD